MAQEQDPGFKKPALPDISVTGDNSENTPIIVEDHSTEPTKESPKEPCPAKLRAQHAYLKPSNPYEKLTSYSHEASTIPPYVLYGISNSSNKEPQQLIDKQGQVGCEMQDPFLASMNDNWSTFFETVDTTPAYSAGILKNDIEALRQLPDLNGRWGGDARLKSYLNDDHADLEEYRKQKALRNLSDSSSLSSYNKDFMKSKSKAKYWMSTEKREEWIPYFERILYTNNYLPLFFRILLFILSVIALAIACNIFRLSDVNGVPQQPSTIMAVCVQTIGLVYLCYITYDEFNSKPLGIRNPVEKMRLILLDLLFIIFSSANIALSFSTLYDDLWVCRDNQVSLFPKINSLCFNQRALSSLLFLILFWWIVTFTISIMRVIKRVSGPGS